jgi:membrane protein DedA with SNARE-associated domain
MSGIVGWVVDLMETLGAPGVGLAIALENVFPPLPSEVFLPLAGFAAARGDLSPVAAIVWTTLGSVVGALALYGVGAALGRERLRAIADRMPLVNVSDVDKAEEWFARHGPKAVFFGRMVPLVRSMISVPAGVERMSPLLFLALTAAGSLIWNSAFVLAGYLLGENWHIVEEYAGIASKLVLVALVLAVVVFLARRIARKRRGESIDDQPTERIPVTVPSGGPAPTHPVPAHTPQARSAPTPPAPNRGSRASAPASPTDATEQIPAVRPGVRRPPQPAPPGGRPSA